jgi:hypothetical protein
VSKGQHAADDGSFQKSAGGAMLRGIALIVAAIVLGVVLLNATDSPEPFVPKVTAADGATTTSPTTSSTGGTTASTTATTAGAKAHRPGEVAVLVVNGSGVSGAAGRNAQKIAAAGYLLKPSGNAKTAAASIVYYKAGYDADARAIAGLLAPVPGVQPMPDPAPVKDLLGANILVVVAADLAK